jgi:hypothetical protein
VIFEQDSLQGEDEVLVAEFVIVGQCPWHVKIDHGHGEKVL